jgi:hypothetical protein
MEEKHYIEWVELIGDAGVMILDDDHTDQLMYSEKGMPHVYLPDHNVNMVFLQSGTPGDWALGEFVICMRDRHALSLSARRLLDHRDRWITMPNNDTLYSIAWLDLSGGPVRFAYPAMDARYFSFAFLDPWTDNVACVSRRTTGGEARTLWLAPPDWTGEAPADVVPMRMASNDLWLLGRVLVDGAAYTVDEPVFHDDPFVANFPPRDLRGGRRADSVGQRRGHHRAAPVPVRAALAQPRACRAALALITWERRSPSCATARRASGHVRGTSGTRLPDRRYCRRS